MFVALLLSALLHALILLSLFTPVSHPLRRPEIVTVEYREGPRRKAEAKGARGRGGKARGIPLSSLVPKIKWDPTAQTDWTADTEEENHDFSGAGTLTMGQVKYTGYLWRMIDSNIEENPFLSEYNHTGKVSLRFEIDEKGRLLSLSATAADRVLKVIAARAVRAAIRNEDGHLQLPPKRMWINANFSWSSYQACETLRGHSANNLSFCHYAENKRRKFTAGEKAGTWLGAIAVHGPWAYEAIQEYNRQERHRKDQFNPFRKYELDPDWNL